MTAKRIQRKRAKGWKMPIGAVCVTRPGKWSNPYRVGMWLNYGATEAVRDFRNWATGNYTCNGTYWGNGTGREMAKAAAAELSGKDQACWCHLCERHKDGKPLGETCSDCDPCHVDVLLEIANAEAKA